MMTSDTQAEWPASLTADAERVWSMLSSIAEISETPADCGVTRWAYTAEEREAHARIGDWFSELGLDVRVDSVGNTIAELKGSRPELPSITTGSHLDSVPAGGRFDGIVGAVGAVETASLLVEHEVQHEHSFRFVAFAAEEGARFGQGCIGSKAVAGRWSPRGLASIRDREGVSIAEAMRSVGFDAEDVAAAAWSPEECLAFIELHIEQGEILEREGLGIGIVDLVSGSTRFEIILKGTASHTGSTPMDMRSDALAAAAEVVLLTESIANDLRHRGTRCTVGKLQVSPGSITTIPGEVSLFVDVRDIDSGRQRDTADEIVRRARVMTSRRDVQLSTRLLSDVSPIVLSQQVRKVTAAVCQGMNVPYKLMYSGASHDAQMVNSIIPAALVFVPSRGGLSHVPQEWTEPTQIAAGIEVLIHSLLALDVGLSD